MTLSHTLSAHRLGEPSFALGPDFPHDLAKPLRFRRDECGELAWRVGNGLGALVGHLFDDLRVPHRMRERRMQFVDHEFGRSGWSDEAEPSVKLVPGQA